MLKIINLKVFILEVKKILFLIEVRNIYIIFKIYYLVNRYRKKIYIIVFISGLMSSCIYNIFFYINGLINDDNSWDTNDIKKPMYYIKKIDTLLHSSFLILLSAITILKLKIKKSVYF